MVESDHSAANSLSADKQELAQLVTDLHFQHYPELVDKFGDRGKKRCYDDAIYHINYLDQAVRVNSNILFSNYLEWAQTMLKERDIPGNDLVNNISFLKQAIRQKLTEPKAQQIIEFIDEALETLQRSPLLEESYVEADNPMSEEAKRYLDLLLSGDREEASEHIMELVDAGTPIQYIYEHIFQKVQYEVGVLWQRNEISVAHEHYCTAATQLIMSRLYPQIFSTQKKGYKLVACSVADELHEIGVRMVADFFEMDGWDTYYLGANMPVSHLISAIKEHKADVLAISVTLPIHIDRAERIINKVRATKQIKDLNILVGGYPFRVVPDLWKKIGADGSGESAKEAIIIANELVRN